MSAEQLIHVTDSLFQTIDRAKLPVVVQTADGPLIPRWVGVVWTALSSQYDGLRFETTVLRLLQRTELIDVMMVIHDAYGTGHNADPSSLRERDLSVHDFLAVRVHGLPVLALPSSET